MYTRTHIISVDCGGLWASQNGHTAQNGAACRVMYTIWHCHHHRLSSRHSEKSFHTPAPEPGPGSILHAPTPEPGPGSILHPPAPEPGPGSTPTLNSMQLTAKKDRTRLVKNNTTCLCHPGAPSVCLRLPGSLAYYMALWPCIPQPACINPYQHHQGAHTPIRLRL